MHAQMEELARFKIHMERPRNSPQTDQVPVSGQSSADIANQAGISHGTIDRLLIAGAIHDLNNSLNALGLRISLLDRGSPAGLKDEMTLLQTGIRDCADLLSRLREYAIPSPGSEVGACSLKLAIREAIKIVSDGIFAAREPERVPVSFWADLENLPLVIGNRADIRHVFINLFLNARDVMPNGGMVTISAKVAPGEVAVTVADQGTGIADEHLARIFDPSFTTKPGDGHGLGLGLVRGVMTRLGGSATAANHPQGGAVFTLKFPTLAAPSRSWRSR
jgi:signal transduction histidine kinase